MISVLSRFLIRQAKRAARDAVIQKAILPVLSVKERDGGDVVDSSSSSPVRLFRSWLN
ncbi:hypothetical protein [Mesorhizobium sp. KR2-14]|uniref:hypothetical protein n=1 Tax=Mesorhizobium sp. KR2-14 TaxID=3156610 RepID=UPI0032B40DBD